MIYPQMLLDLAEEISVDLFAGGGGASCGYEIATGRNVDVAVNHDRDAVAMHEANHPQTRHLRSDVYEVDPYEVTLGRPVGLLWASPDCTYHSKARGGKPIRHKSKKRRALAWVVKRWAGQVRPRVIMLENVEEFANWCPLVARRDKKTGRVKRSDGTVAPAGERTPVDEQELVPCERRLGRTFRQWVRDLEDLGYVVEWRELRACDYGAPTIRKRLFLIARCDGRPIVWPEPTHGVGKGLKPYRTAAECIDWSEPMLSIFATREEARVWGRAHKGKGTPVRPLAKNTMRRIARGVMRYVIENPEPYTVGVGGRAGQSPERSLRQPYQTVTAKGDAAVVVPEVRPPTWEEWYAATRDHGGTWEEYAKLYGLDPEGGPDGGGAGGPVVAPHVTKFRSGSVGHGIDEPLHTVTANSYRKRPGGATPLGIAAPVLVPNMTNNAPHSVASPVPTVTGGGRNMLVSPYLVPRYGEREGQTPRTRSIEEPSPVVVPTGNGAMLAAAYLATYYGGDDTDRRGAGLDAPLHTQPTENRHALVSAFLTQHNDGFYKGAGRSLQGPAGTVCASGSPQSLTAVHLLKNKDTSSAADAGDPLHTIAAGGTHHGLIASFLQKYYGEGVGQELGEPAHTIPTMDRFGLVTVQIEGEPYVIADIAMRMLQPRELYRAQGFPDSYVIDRGRKGKRLTKTAQVRMCGNSVCPPIAAALIRSQVPEMIARDEVLNPDSAQRRKCREVAYA